MISRCENFNPMLKCPCCGEEIFGKIEQVSPGCSEDYYVIELYCNNCKIYITKNNRSSIKAHTKAINKFIKIATKAKKKMEKKKAKI